MKLTILHNPGASHGDVAPEVLCDAFAAAGMTPAYRTFGEESPADVDHADLVVIAGGDGTVARFIHHYADAARRFTILPMGTSNNVATGHGIAGDAAALAAGLRDARARPLDLGRIAGPFGERTFVEGVGLGAVAAVMAVAAGLDLSGERKRALSRDRLPAALDEAPPRRWQAAVDGNPLPEDLLFLEIMNAPLIGPGLRPRAGPSSPDMGDGLLGVAFLAPGGRAAACAGLERGDGATLDCDGVQGRDVSLTWRNAVLRIDDDFLDPPAGAQPLRARVLRSGLQLLVPRQPEEGSSG